MKTFLSICLISISCSSFAGGVAVGNGGTVARCGLNDGYLSLDHLLAPYSFDDDVYPLAISKIEKSYGRILRLIKEKLPQLFGSFEVFIKNLDNKDDFTKPYVWISVYDDKLATTDDQNISFVPVKCKMFSSGIVLSQAVVRVKRYSYKNSSSKIIFYYNRTVFAGIRPLELSFIQVHEWLWNFTNDINTIRRINYFIHSNLFDEYSAQETKEFFKQFNLNINLDR